MALEQFERRIASAVESIFSKGAPRGIEPAEIGRRLVREIERDVRIGVRSEIAPNRIVVALAPSDLEELGPLRARVEEELAELARETVDDNGFELLGPIALTIDADPQLKAGTFYIDTAFVEDATYRNRWRFILPDGAPVELGPGSYIIGRQSGADVRIDDNRVSRRHAEVTIAEGTATVTDLGSTNGTFVNGERVARPTELQAGDVLRLGAVEVRVERG
ncbi:FHA domain containing protein [Acidimicrobium ferrooxidans DSM 10331]|uniref:FHA domain containing protein n=1 Tax=Acidimicrobium ferrooxidans (strain DSM 10331 / JCM 15462 / NBRC 103882 / ICP) TaxID=525909 RepID=C7M1L4_ACIFD|nr:DUF3662 and FHA domain-containing protein [Acidimicrobium ferrooxidans]ACU53063.1 FHA domain containing protein [Acidimicrobium ferrooxidans DSM 10331]